MKSRKKLSSLLLTILFVLTFGFINSPAPALSAPVELLIGAAVSLRDVTQDLAAAYNAKNANVTLSFTYASSGALQTQIEEGAPIDIFMSAAAAQMRNLENKGLIYGSSRNLARNTPVLIVPADSQAGIEGFADVTVDAIKLIGLGDPETMPLGRIAREIFTALGIADEVSAKTVLASDVRQTLTWVETGEVDAGVVFMTDAITTDKVRVVEIADSSLHTPAINPVGIVNASPNKDEARKFIDFLFSNEAREIFGQYGFLMYE